MANVEVIANPYRPQLLRIVGMRDETPDVRTLRLSVDGLQQGLIPDSWAPGQFGEFSVFGAGECVFALANASPSMIVDGLMDNLDEDLHIECTFRRIGKVTTALSDLGVGHTVGFRGPYGNSFPIDDWAGRSLVFIGGGIGMAALRACVQAVLAQRERFVDVHILNGARTVADLVYKGDMEEWRQVDGVEVVSAVDPGGETGEWEGEVGLLPDVFERLGLDPEDRVVVACGPPIMLHFLFLTLDRIGYRRDQVVTTLENKMKCGVGLCGRCNVGRFFVCRDGPVVSWAQLGELPAEL